MNESQRPVCQGTKGPKSETVLDKWCGDDGQKTPNTQDPAKRGVEGARDRPQVQWPQVASYNRKVTPSLCGEFF